MQLHPITAVHSVDDRVERQACATLRVVLKRPGPAPAIRRLTYQDETQSNPQLEIQIRDAKFVVFYTSEQQFSRANVHA